MIQLSGAGTANGYELTQANGNNWNNTSQSILSFDVKYSETFTIAIDVDTANGQRFIKYALGSGSPIIDGTSITHFISADNMDGNWHTIQRDLVADLAAAEPGNSLVDVNNFRIRGSGLIDAINLSGGLDTSLIETDLAAATDSFISTHYSYDSLGRVEFTVDGEGYVSHNIYDDNGRVTRVVNFADPVSGLTEYTSVEILTALTATLDWRNAEHVESQFIYDTLGQLKFSVDPEGYVTENIYDANGQVVKSNRYYASVDINVDYDQASLLLALSDALDWENIPAALTVVDNVVTRVDGNDNYSAHTNTVKTFVDGNGAIEFTVPTIGNAGGSDIIVGLNKEGSVNAIDNYDFSFYLSGSDMWVYEFGDLGGYGEISNVSSTDTFRILMEDGVVQYQRKQVGGEFETFGTSLSTMDTAAEYTLNVSIYDDGAQVNMGDATNAQPNSDLFIYNSVGQIRFQVNPAGFVSENVYDALGNLIETKQYNQKFIPQTSLPTENELELFVANLQDDQSSNFSEDFSSGPSLYEDFTLSGDANHPAVYKDGDRMAFRIAPSELETPILSSNSTFEFSDKAVSRFEITTDLNINDGFFEAGIRSDGSYANNDYYFHDLLVYQGVVYASNLPNGAVLRNIGTVDPETTYVVEYETSESSSTIYIYELGLSRADGFVDSVEVDTSVWNTYRLEFSASSYPQAQEGAITYLDNIQILNPSANTTSSTKYIYDSLSQVRFVIDAEGYVSENIFDAFGQVVEVKRYSQQISSEGVLNEVDVINALQTQWLLDFDSEDIQDLDGFYHLIGSQYRPEGAMELTGGKLVFNLEASSSPSDREQLFLNSGTEEYKVGGLFQSEITIENISDSSNYFRSSLDASGSGHSYELSIRFEGNQARLFATSDPLQQPQFVANIGTVEENKTYVTQFELAENSISVYIFEKGQSRADGYELTHSILNQSWEEVAFNHTSPRTLTFDSIPTNKITVDNFGYVLTTEPFSISSYNAFDSLGRVRYSVDAEGYVLENIYDANNNIIETKNYNKSILIENNDWNITSIEKALNNIEENFSDDTFENFQFSDTNSPFVYHAEEQLVLGSTLTLGGDKPYFESKIDQRLGDRFTNSFELTTGDSISRTSSFVGMQNGGSYANGDLIRHNVGISGGSFIASHVENFDINVSTTLGQALANTTYVIEFESTPDSSTIYIYEKGTNRESGWQNTVVASDSIWGDVHLQFDAGTSGDGAAGDDVYIDNITLDKNIQNIATKYVYDDVGQVRFIIDGDGYITENGYDHLGNLTESSRYVTRYTAVESATLESLKDFISTGIESNTSKYIYNKLGQVRFTINELNQVSENTFDHLGNIVQTKNYQIPLTNSVELSIDSITQFLVTEESDFRKTTFSYDNLGQLVSTTDALESQEIHVYDAFGNRTAFTNKNGATWHYEYDSLNQLVKETSPEVEIFNSDGTLLGLHSLIKLFQYDAWGRLTSMTEAVGESSGNDQARTTQYVYDKLGNQETIIHNDQGVYDSELDRVIFTGKNTSNTTLYNYLGLAIVNIDERGSYSFKTYNDNGQIEFEIDAEGYVTGYEFNSQGLIAKLTRFSEAILGLDDFKAVGVSLSSQDVLDKLVENSDLDRVIRTEYNAAGLKEKVILNAVTGYDVATESNYTSNPETRYSYNAFGQQIKESIKINDTEWADSYSYYNNLAQLTATVDAEGYLTEFEYDNFGNLEKKIEYAGRINNWDEQSYTLGTLSDDDRTTSYLYDLLNRQTHIIYEQVSVGQKDSGGNYIHQKSDVTEQVIYDAIGREVSHIDGSGAISTTSYDKLGRVTEVAGSSRLVAESGQLDPFLRDSSGALTSQVNSQTTTTMKYNAHGEVISTIQNGVINGVVSQSTETKNLVDFHGNVVRTTNPLGHETYREFNEKGQVVSRWNAASFDVSAGTEPTTYEYDKNGLQTESTSIVELNGTELNSNRWTHITTYQTYNAFGELSTLWKRSEREGENPGDSSIVDTTYHTINEYNNNGLLVRTNQDAGIYKNFEYDLAGRATHISLLGDESITEDDRHTYIDYDSLGNTTFQQGVAFTAYQNSIVDTSSNLVAPIVTQAYDRWGNIVEQDVNGVVTEYKYNYRNLLVEEVQAESRHYDETGAFFDTNKSTKIYYDERGLKLADENESGFQTQYEYNSAAEMTASINRDGHITEYAYDSLGRQVAIKDVLGFIRTTHFDANGQTTKVGIVRQDSTAGLQEYKSGLDNPTDLEEVIINSYLYNSLGQRVVEYRGDNEFTGTAILSYTYNSFGNILRTREINVQELDVGGLGGSGLSVSVEFDYDIHGNQIKEKFDNTRMLTKVFDEFGRLEESTNLSFYTTTYLYDDFGQLKTEKNASGVETRTYEYFENGLLKAINDNTTIQVEVNGVLEDNHTTNTDSFRYDINSRQVYEGNHRYFDGYFFDNYVTTDTDIQIVQTRYDDLGRVIEVHSPTNDFGNGISSLINHYDERGNKRAVIVDYDVRGESGTQSSSTWHTYDKEDRLLTVKGTLNGGLIEAQEEAIYNALGQRVQTRISEGNKQFVVNDGLNPTTVTVDVHANKEFSYDDLGRINQVRERNIFTSTDGQNSVGHGDWQVTQNKEVDDWGQLTEQIDYTSESIYSVNGTHDTTDLDLLASLSLEVEKESRASSEYNDSGQVISQKNYAYNDDGDEYLSSQLADRVANAYGNVESYKLDVFTEDDSVSPLYHIDYDITYAQFESFKQSTLTATDSRNPTDSGVTQYYYDRFGNLDRIKQQQEDDPNSTLLRKFETNRQGQIINEVHWASPGGFNGPSQAFYYINGQGIADLGDINGADFDYNQQGFDKQLENVGASRYVVKSGDTLKSIAKSVYGDSSLWYQLAMANGISDDSQLTQGISLNIPENLSNTNNADNFRPYNPGDIIGDNNPIAIAPDPAEVACKVVEQIIMVAVIVIVAYYAGAAASEAIYAAYAAETAAAVGGAFVGGVAGSAAGQVVGKELGIVDSFSLRAAVANGLTAAATAGISSGLQAGNIAAGNAKTLTATQRAWVGASGVIAGAAANKIAGINDSGFRWANVAANAASGALLSNVNTGEPNAINALTTSNSFGAQVGTNILASGLRYAVTKGFFNEGSWNNESVVGNAFGSALGNAVVAKFSLTKEQNEQAAIADERKRLEDSGINLDAFGPSPFKTPEQTAQDFFEEKFGGLLDDELNQPLAPSPDNVVEDSAVQKPSPVPQSGNPSDSESNSLTLSLDSAGSFAGLHLNSNDIRKILESNAKGAGFNARGNLETFARTFGLGEKPILNSAAFGGFGSSNFDLSADEVNALASLIRSASDGDTPTDSLFIVGDQGVDAFNDYVSDIIGNYDVSQAFQASNLRNGVEAGEVLNGAGVFAAARLESEIANTGFLTQVGETGLGALWDSGSLDVPGYLLGAAVWAVGQTIDGISTAFDSQAPFGDRLAAGFGLALEGAPLTKFLKLNKLSGSLKFDFVEVNSFNKQAGSLGGPRISLVPNKADEIARLSNSLEFRKRTLELSLDPDRGQMLVREGIGAARFEQATGRTVLRSTDGATDFIDPKLGPFDLKGPLRANDGSPIDITPKRVEGLGKSVIKEANNSTASKAVVVDTLGLTKEQISILKIQVQNGLKTKKPIIYVE